MLPTTRAVAIHRPIERFNLRVDGAARAGAEVSMLIRLTPWAPSARSLWT